MTQPIVRLTTEEQFQIKYFEVQVRHMDERTAKDSLKALYTKMVYSEADFKQILATQWGMK